MLTGGHAPDWYVTDATVEGLFVRALGQKIKHHAACLEELRSIGVDPTQRLKPRYAADTYEKAVIAVRRHLYADEPDDTRALWKMGRETTDGFYRTILGGAIGAVVKLLSPERMLPRLPANITNSTNYMKAKMEQRGPREYELYVFGSNHAAYIAGAVERGVEQTGARPKIEIMKSAPLEAWLSITW